MIKEVKRPMLEKVFLDCYAERGSLANLVGRFGFTTCVNKLQELYTIEELKQYLHDYCMRTFYDKRIIISRNAFSESFLGKKLGGFKATNTNTIMFQELINTVIKQVYELEKKDFIATNRKEMHLENDVWRLCFCKGPALNKRDFDFINVNSSTLRKEVKMYYKAILWYEVDFRNDRGFALLYAALNLITSVDGTITHFKDITPNHIRRLISSIESEELTTQFGKGYTIESMRKMVQQIGKVIDYLMTVEGYAYTPNSNPTEGFQFRNTKSMVSNTDAIPDIVIEQLDKYCYELEDSYGLIYEILAATGLRAKEAIYLEVDCLKQSEENELYYVLEYTPYKIVNKLKKTSKINKQITIVDKEIAVKIYNQIEKTKELRQAENTNYIFLRQVNSGTDNTMVALPQVSNFVSAVNKVISNHNICDESGELWHYTSRQARKTLGVRLAENGATSQQIANQLGHLDFRTTEKYYAEVRQKRLMELNTDFFNKKFELLLGKEQLATYTEEERKGLYIDFALNVREVEFGQCTKHMSEGPCGKRTGATHCAICPKLCTGKKYLTKWLELRDCQQEIVDNLLSIYKREGVENYEEFIEYRKEMSKLNRYELVVQAIQEQKGNSDVINS